MVASLSSSQSEGLGPSAGPVVSHAFEAIPPTSIEELDRKVGRLKEQARSFARLGITQKIALLTEIQRRLRDVSTEWVAAGCRAKGIPLDEPVAGDEWIGGPGVTLRNIRFLIRALTEIKAGGVPTIDPSWVKEVPGGAVGVQVTPYDSFDTALYGGITAETRLARGISASEIGNHQASFYKKRDPEGGVCLVLGAGNVSSIPPMDVLYKSFVDGEVCILKMNPVNEYIGPFVERAFHPMIERGYLAVVYGGAEVGQHLTYHPNVDSVHITGSDKTHDMIVWGPPGAEREDRKRRKDPVLKKPITSELGNVSPVLVVPGPYSDSELGTVAEHVAGMITQNASFNCNAAKLLVLPKGWKQREPFLRALSSVLSKVPPRKAYYPGAHQRFESLTQGHADVRKFGAASGERLPWTLVLGLDPDDPTEKNFMNEPFCSILSEVAVGSDDPVAFLSEAVPFANDRVWGTLSGMLFVHPKSEADGAVKNAVEAAVRDLRYGAVAINAWPALAYALCSTPWGGHPTATLDNVQSGLGWVHNTVMLENIEKCVVRTPLRAVPKQVYFPTHRTAHQLGRKLVDFEASPSWLKVPAMALTALRG